MFVLIMLPLKMQHITLLEKSDDIPQITKADRNEHHALCEYGNVRAMLW